MKSKEIKCNCGSTQVEIRQSGIHATAYCSICGKYIKHVGKWEERTPTRCIDSIMKYCQECPHGYVKYPDGTETKADLEGIVFESGCKYGLENTQATEEEIKEFDAWCKRHHEKV